MNSFLQGNGLWILIILLLLGSNGNVFNSSVFTGCAVPFLIALGYCMLKNGSLCSILGNGCGCGCNNN